jgi:transposase
MSSTRRPPRIVGVTQVSGLRRSSRRAHAVSRPLTWVFLWHPQRDSNPCRHLESGPCADESADRQVPHRQSRRTQRRDRSSVEIVGDLRESGDQDEYPSQWKAIESISAKLSINHETLRIWVRRAETDAGVRPGLTTDERARLRELEREVKELRRANEILKAASAFFARELDPRPPK